MVNDKISKEIYMISREECIERINNNDFLFDEGAIVKFFGRRFTEKLKRNNPEGYCILRDDPTFMPRFSQWNN